MLDELNDVLNTDNTITVGAGVGGATYTHLVQDSSTEVIAVLTIAFISVKLIIAVIMGILSIVLKYRECKKNRRKSDKNENS